MPCCSLTETSVSVCPSDCLSVHFCAVLAICMLHVCFSQILHGCSDQTAVEGQDLPRMYLAHHELESVVKCHCYVAVRQMSLSHQSMVGSSTKPHPNCPHHDAGDLYNASTDVLVFGGHDHLSLACMTGMRGLFMARPVP